MAEESKLTVERLSALLGISDPDETVKVHLDMGSTNIPQTVSSVQIGDTTTSFKTSAAEFSESLMKNYKPVLNRYRKVVF